VRSSAAEAYLKPARKRKNLKVVTGAQASRVLFEGERASGVEYRVGKKSEQATAKREVLLCGGALNSPQLLMLSGIGPAEELQAHGIALRVDAPGRRRQPAGPPRRLHDAALHAEDHLRPRQRHRRRPAVLPVQAGPGHQQHRRGRRLPALEVGPRTRARTSSSTSCRRNWTITAGTSCRATATRCTPATCARSAAAACAWPAPNPADKVRIEANYLSDAEGHDWQMMLECVRLSREIFAQPAFAPYRGEEIFPARREGRSGRCASSSRRRPSRSTTRSAPAAWASDADSVVDPQLRVRGVQGPARGRRFGHAEAHRRQHQRAHDHDRRSAPPTSSAAFPSASPQAIARRAFPSGSDRGPCPIAANARRPSATPLAAAPPRPLAH
jgi:choline dehydrogenase